MLLLIVVEDCHQSVNVEVSIFIFRLLCGVKGYLNEHLNTMTSDFHFFFFLTNLSKIEHKIHGSKPKTLLGVELLHPPIYIRCPYFMASGVSCTITSPFKIVAAQKNFLESWR